LVGELLSGLGAGARRSTWAGHDRRRQPESAGGDGNALSVATVIGVTGVPIAAGCPRPLEWCGLDPAR
jgi:hypothetical protein